MFDMFSQLRQAKEDGRKIVGMYCAYGPKELVLAAGALAFSLCATKEEPIVDGEKTLPRNFCPLIKSSYGMAVTDKCPYFLYSDLVLGETTCDGKKKMFELMSKFKPVHVMRLPSSYQDENDSQYWLSEVQRLKERLEQDFAVEITDAKLVAAIKMLNKERRLMQRLSEFTRLDPTPVSGLEMLNLHWGQNFIMDRAEFAAQIEEMIDMIQERVDKQEAAFPRGAKRIVVSGVPTGIGAEKVVRIIEECGAAVVYMETCSGMKPHMQLVDETKPPLEAIAEKYLKTPCSCMSPNPIRMERFGPIMEEYRPHGVVDVIWQGCHTYNVESQVLKNHLQATYDIPFLRIETDYSQSDSEQIRTRVQAFLEMMD